MVYVLCTLPGITRVRSAPTEQPAAEGYPGFKLLGGRQIG
jgi:hypothetical protein